MRVNSPDWTVQRIESAPVAAADTVRNEWRLFLTLTSTAT